MNLSQRLHALATLEQMGASARMALPALHRIGPADPEKLRQKIGEAIVKIGQPSREDVPALVEALGSPSLRFRTAAAQTLWLLGPEAKAAAPRWPRRIARTRTTTCDWRSSTRWARSAREGT